MRWDTDDRTQKKSNPGISTHAKYRILVAFRLLQRCRRMSEFKKARKEFLQRVEDIIYDRTPDFEVSQAELDEIDRLVKAAKEESKRSRGGRTRAKGGCDWADEDSSVDPDYVPGEDDDKFEDDSDAKDFAKTEERRRLRYKFVEKHFVDNWFPKFWIREFRRRPLPGTVFTDPQPSFSQSYVDGHRNATERDPRQDVEYE